MTKFLEKSKLKAFADNKLNIAKTKISPFDREENNVGKGENASYQHILLFPQCIPKPSSLTHSHTMTPFDAPVTSNFFFSHSVFYPFG